MKSQLRHPLAIFFVATLCAFLAGCGLFEEETYHPPQGDGPWILVDLYHTRKQNHEDYRLSKGEYAYQGVFGWHRAFEHLNDNGYKSRTIRTLPLSEERLEGFDVLFINLVDDDRPDFSAAEIADIQRFVERGGGLLVIGDHTNVYESSARINPLLAPMGIEVGYHTAIDYPPEYSVAGLAWIMVFDFERHYLTRDVEMISLQTGAPVFGDFGIARLSERGFGDYWDPEDLSGYYGDWNHNGDPEVEPKGRLPVVQAREYGDGRVVVVGDQNIFGDAWLHFGDNFEFLMNTFQWLAGAEDRPPLRDARLAGFNLGVDMSHNDFDVGRTGDDDYYVFYVHLNRDHDVSADAQMRLETWNDALMLLSPDKPFDEEALDKVRQYFRDGKTVVLSLEADHLSQASVDLLADIAPEFSLTVDATRYVAAQAAAGEMVDLEIPHLEKTFLLDSPVIPISNLSVSSLPRRSQIGDEGLSPYLLEISSEWGDPFITARSGGDVVDIARRKAIGEGELIVFVQDGFFRNRTLGYSETTPPTDQTADAIELQYRLLDYLKSASQ